MQTPLRLPTRRRVLAIYPYRKDPLSLFAEAPPLGLELICSCIEDQCEILTIVDRRFEESVDVWLTETDIILLSLNWGHSKAIGASAKKYALTQVLQFVASLPEHIFVIAGGRFAGENPDEVFASCPNLDIIVRGYGERTISELFELSGQETYAEVAGISYKNHHNTIVHNSAADPCFMLDRYPNRQRRRYQYQFGSLKVDGIFASRGCPYRCKFCEMPVKRWLSRSAQSIVEEIKSMDSDVELIYFGDDNFLMDLKRARLLCELLQREKIRKTFVIECRVDSLARSPQTVRALAQAGFCIGIGIESWNRQVLDWLQKGYRPQQAETALAVLRQTRILTLGFFIIGNVGETGDSMQQVGQRALALGLDHISVSRLRCYENTALQSELAGNTQYSVDDRGIVYSQKYPVAQLNAFVKNNYRDFYRWPKVLSGLGRLARHINVSKFVRHLALRIIILKLLKKPALWYRLAPWLRRLNPLFPIDFVLNTLLKLLARRSGKVLKNRYENTSLV